MSNLDLDALEAIARAATPGPWKADREYHACYLNDEADCEYPDSPVTERTEWRAGVDGALYDAVHHVHASYDSHLIAPDVAGNYDYEDGGIIHTEDAEYIAAFDPTTTLALIARIREAEEAADGEAAAHNDTISAWREAVDKLREAEATIEAVRANLSNAPECDEHPDDGPITCGWKSDMIRVRAVIARHQDKREGGSEQ